MRERVCGKPRGGCPCGSAYAVLCGSSFAEFGQCQLFATESSWRLVSYRYGAREGYGRLRLALWDCVCRVCSPREMIKKVHECGKKYTRLVKL